MTSQRSRMFLEKKLEKKVKQKVKVVVQPSNFSYLNENFYLSYIVLTNTKFVSQINSFKISIQKSIIYIYMDQVIFLKIIKIIK